MSMVIGGSDGPTAVFLAGKLGEDWFNPFGLFFILMMLLPNMLYAVRSKGREKKKCDKKYMVITEQIGRYASMFLMVFNIGILEYGFFSFEAITFYLITNFALLAVYSVVWFSFFWKETYQKAILLAVVPAAMFVFSGIFMRHILLILSGIVFGVGHFYVTSETFSK